MVSYCLIMCHTKSMRKNKGFAPIAIVLIILAALAVGGAAYYKVKGSKTATNVAGVNNSLSKNLNSIATPAGDLKITGNWIHAQEEDAGGNLVYRNSETYTPAPLRFRYYFTVKENGICGSLQLAANDGQSLKDVNCSLTTDGKTTFFTLDNQKYIVVSQSASKLVLKLVDTTTTDLKTYQNNTYGFGLKYPSMWAFRDGNKDWKPADLKNFYQFCDSVITNPSGPADTNANFVGSCEGENLKVSIWKPNTAMKTITNDFATLKLDQTNKMTIGGKSASELVYSGLSQTVGGTHTWNLFVVPTANFIYSISGNVCMDNQAECSQIIDTFNLSKIESNNCLPTTTPFVKIISPNGGETYTAGKQITVKWESCNTKAPISLILIKHNSSVPYTQNEGQGDYAGFNLGGFDPNVGVPNDGVAQVTLPNSSNANLTLGKHYFMIVAGQDDPSIGPGFNPRDLSDNLFTINNATPPPASHCGLTIDSPIANSSVSFPLTITGTIDNKNSNTTGCSWTMFEGQAGVAHLYDFNNGKTWHAVGLNIPVKVADWTAEATQFSVVIPFDNSNAGFIPGTPMKVVFTAENPSGSSSVNTLNLPLLLK